MTGWYEFMSHMMLSGNTNKDAQFWLYVNQIKSDKASLFYTNTLLYGISAANGSVY